MKKKPSERQEYWRGEVAEQEASGKAIREFCRERNSAEHAFYWWRQHLRKEKSVSFALVETKPAATAVQFELRVEQWRGATHSGRCVEFARGVRGLAGDAVIGLPGSVRVYLCMAPCDMRRSFDGLQGLVTSVMELDALFQLLSGVATENYSNGQRSPKEQVTSKICYTDENGKQVCQ